MAERDVPVPRIDARLDKIFSEEKKKKKQKRIQFLLFFNEEKLSTNNFYNFTQSLNFNRSFEE